MEGSILTNTEKISGKIGYFTSAPIHPCRDLTECEWRIHLLNIKLSHCWFPKRNMQLIMHPKMFYNWKNRSAYKNIALRCLQQNDKRIVIRKLKQILVHGKSEHIVYLTKASRSRYKSWLVAIRLEKKIELINYGPSTLRHPQGDHTVSEGAGADSHQ